MLQNQQEHHISVTKYEAVHLEKMHLWKIDAPFGKQVTENMKIFTSGNFAILPSRKFPPQENNTNMFLLML